LALRKAGSAPYWQHTSELLLYAAEIEKEPIDDARAKLNRALYRDGLMWVAGFSRR
jgi:hypothetical protein